MTGAETSAAASTPTPAGIVLEARRITRHFGADYPDLAYVAQKGGLIRVVNVKTGEDLGVFLDLTRQVNEAEDHGLIASVADEVAKKWIRDAMSPVQPVWWLAPSPAPLSPWKYS